MKAIDRKLWRDFGQLRGQVLTICLVVGAGIAGFIAMQTAYRALLTSRDAYYERQRFGDVFAATRRAPEQAAAQLREVPGVAVAYTRVVESIRVPLADATQAATGRIVSLPDHGDPPLNGVFLIAGRMPESGRHDEALLLESFAEAQGIAAGDRLPVVINGALRQVIVTGLAMSPEYVFAFGGNVLAFKPGDFAVLWMPRSAVAPAFDMDGAFNDVVLKLQPGASLPATLGAVDRVLAPYGGFGAYGRDKQPSDHFVSSELDGLQVTVTIIPLIFLGVAAFLVNVVLGRLVELQRGQIATLKAVGYGNLAVGLHYLKLVAAIVLLGAAVGIGVGALLGDGLLSAYRPYFRFPDLEARFDASVIGVSVSISLAAALVGAFISVRQIVVMPPAEAMRPAAPPTYSTTLFDRFGGTMFGAMGQMVLREMRRRPGRLMVSVVGISLAVAIMIIGNFASDSMAHMLELQFERAMGEDLTVALTDPLPHRIEGELLALDGVTHVEGIRSVPVRLRAGALVRDTVIEGLPDQGRLRSLLNREGKPVDLPLSGLAISQVLAERLHLQPGDPVSVALLEGDRRAIPTTLAATVDDMLGMQGYMRRAELQRLLQEEPMVSTALLSVAAESMVDVQRRLQALPAVAAVASPKVSMRNFTETQGGTMLAMSLVMAMFAAVIAVGIVYNNARVTLSMRSRDLASMRVLGFTRREISSVLLGELAVHVLLAMPLGMWLGTLAGGALMAADPDNYRMPAVVAASTYVSAALVTIGAALVSGLLVRRKLDRLDLIGVLKTRE